MHGLTYVTKTACNFACVCIYAIPNKCPGASHADMHHQLMHAKRTQAFPRL